MLCVKNENLFKDPLHCGSPASSVWIGIKSLSFGCQIACVWCKQLTRDVCVYFGESVVLRAWPSPPGDSIGHSIF